MGASENHEAPARGTMRQCRLVSRIAELRFQQLGRGQKDFAGIVRSAGSAATTANTDRNR
jgi:hypothetical protein